MPKILTDYERKGRENNPNYFKNGKPKKGSMMCKDRSYISSVTKINGGYCNPSWICGGNSCPLYATGCDNSGEDWE